MPPRQTLIVLFWLVVFGCSDPPSKAVTKDPTTTNAGTPTPTLRPGYSGPIASDQARALLRKIAGAVFVDTEGAYGGGEWQVEGLVVIPNYLTGKGPILVLKRPGIKHSDPYQRNDGTFVLPMESDGDVADIYTRVTGKSPKGLSGPVSISYREALIK